jgi:hypothetical protein
MPVRRRFARGGAVASLVLLGACAAPGRQAPPPPAVPVSAQGKLAADATWSGTVVLADDLLVPRGRTLRILAGTRVLVRPADTTKTEPEYLDNATELLVRGRLLVEGTASSPVVFALAPPEPGAAAEPDVRWGGLIFDGGGGEVRHARISGADTGVTLIGASPALADLAVSGVRQGIAVHRGSAPKLARVVVDAQEGGVSCWPGSAPELDAVQAAAVEHEGLLVAPGAAPVLRGSHFRGGSADVLWAARAEPPPGLGARLLRRAADPPAAAPPPPPPFEPRVPPRAASPTRVYTGEQFIGEATRWEGEVLIDGTVMVAPVALLTIAPGTVVSFAYRDTDGDGLGESELFVQGRLLAEGTREAPIVFTALDGAGPGRWGAINLMGTDVEESVLSWCLVESAYRGLHGHFSRFRVEHSVFRGNARSLQFQESTAAITDCSVSASISGLRFRDSTVAIDGLAVFGNTVGIQVLRSSFTIAGAAVLGNALAGLNVRESDGTIAGGRFEGNAPGLRVSDSRLRIEGNRICGNGGAGLQLRRTEGRVEGNRIDDNAGNGVSTDSPGAALHGNAVAGNLRFALESNTREAIDASGNWWGPAAPAADAIFDGHDDPALGPVLTAPALAAAPAVP